MQLCNLPHKKEDIIHPNLQSSLAIELYVSYMLRLDDIWSVFDLSLYLRSVWNKIIAHSIEYAKILTLICSNDLILVAHFKIAYVKIR